MAKLSDNKAAPVTNDGEVLNGYNGKAPAKKGNDFYEIVGRIIDKTVEIVGLVLYVPARILDNFVDHNKPGIKILAACIFMVGIAMSTDSFYQSFGGRPLFPFWETPGSWIGVGWLWVWTRINFWAAVAVALGVMWIESKAIRGKGLGEAKRDYESIKHHTIPEKNANAIDLVEARRKDYKRAGMGERSILGLFVLVVIIADFLSAFVLSRNPWGQPPAIFLGMVLYNFVAMVAGESGYVLWHQTDRK